MSDIVNQRVNTYLKKQEIQFGEWKKKDLHKNYTFIEDGVVNPDYYFSNENRILFLLKEAYSNEQDNRPLTDWLNDKKERVTTIWRRVSEWTRLIVDNIEGNSIVPFKRDSEFANNGNEFLGRVAVVNIKKSNGKPSSEAQELMSYATADRKELFEQLQLCDPTIIVSGNVRECLSKILEVSKEVLTEIDRDNYIYTFKLNGHNVLVIDYWHPANRYPNLMNYYGFANVCKIAFERSK